MPYSSEELIELIEEKPISARRLHQLIDKGVDPNQKVSSRYFMDVDDRESYFDVPLLHLIAGKPNSVELARVLIERGADIGLTLVGQPKQTVQNTPLLTAIAKDDPKLAVFLIDQYKANNRIDLLNQADISEYAGNTPLMLALKKGEFGVAYYLIEQGCDLNIGDRHPRFPLDMALYWHYPELIIYLKSKGAQKSALHKSEISAETFISDKIIEEDMGCHQHALVLNVFYHHQKAKIKNNKHAKSLNIISDSIIDYLNHALTHPPEEIFTHEESEAFVQLLEMDKKTELEKIFSTSVKEDENSLLRKIHLLIDESKQFVDETNSHHLDKSIMKHWRDLRKAGINEGLFSGNESQEDLYELLDIHWDANEDPPGPLTGLMLQFKRRFVIENITDGFEGDYKSSNEKSWTSVNPIEFWLVLEYYVNHVRLQYENFSSLPDILPDALDPMARNEAHYPSHSGFISNVFLMVLQNYIINDIPPPKNTTVSNNNQIKKSAPEATSSSLPSATAETMFSLSSISARERASSSLPETHDEAIEIFSKKYKDKLKAERNACFGIFRKSRLSLDESLTLNKIFEHALDNNGYRTRAVLKTLGWLDERNQIHPDIHKLFNQAHDSSSKKTV